MFHGSRVWLCRYPHPHPHPHPDGHHPPGGVRIKNRLGGGGSHGLARGSRPIGRRMLVADRDSIKQAHDLNTISASNAGMGIDMGRGRLTVKTIVSISWEQGVHVGIINVRLFSNL
jgi:hypothetical protein